MLPTSLEGSPVLYPGVELTAADGTHLLILLDPSRTQAHIDELLSRAEVPVSQRSTSEAQSRLNVEQLLDLFGDDALVIGAHVNGPKGLLCRLDGQARIRVLRHRGLAAVEVDPCLEIDDSWLNGSKPQIGRRHSQVWSSDAHNYSDLGRRFTWVKMTTPNLEGLRLALLDGASSLKPAKRGDSEDPNVHADLAIESITVSKGQYMGQSSPITVLFNPWLNAIIGGRGTGKSTLVDFCRKALRREIRARG